MPEYEVLTPNNERRIAADRQRRTDEDFLFINGTSRIVGTVPVVNCEGIYEVSDTS